MKEPITKHKDEWVPAGLHIPLVALFIFLLLLIGICTPLSAFGQGEKDEKATAKTHAMVPAFKHKEILYMLLLGEMAASRKMPNIALEQYIRAATETGDAAIAQQATVMSISQQAPTEALISSILWAKADANDLHAQLIAATLLIGKSVQEAKPYLIRAIAIDPKQIDQHILEIQSRLSGDSAKNMKEALTQIAQERPTDAYAHLTAAQSAAERGDAVNAALWVDSALKQIPNLTRGLELKARLISFENKSDAPALIFINEKLKQFPENNDLRLFYASALIDNEKFEEAKSQLSKLTEDKKLGGTALVLLGELYVRDKKLTDATNALQKALEFSESKDKAQYLLGEIAEFQGNKKAALEWYSNVAKSPYHVPATLRAAALLKESQSYQDAIMILHNSNPTTGEEQKQLFIFEIDILNASKQSQDALELANEVLFKIPDDSDMLYARAVTATKLKKWSLAETDLKKILKKNGNNANALNALGYILTFNPARQDEAIKYLAQALAISPNNPAFMDSLGWAYYRKGNPKAALDYLQKASSISDNATIAAHLGEVLWMNDQKDQAMKIWKKGLENNPTNEDLVETLQRLKVEVKN